LNPAQREAGERQRPVNRKGGRSLFAVKLMPPLMFTLRPRLLASSDRRHVRHCRKFFDGRARYKKPEIRRSLFSLWL